MEICKELYVTQNATVILKDSSGSLSWAQRRPENGFIRRKHVDVQYHFVAEMIKIVAVHIITDNIATMQASYMGKPFEATLFKHAIIPLVYIAIIEVNEETSCAENYSPQ